MLERIYNHRVREIIKNLVLLYGNNQGIADYSELVYLPIGTIDQVFPDIGLATDVLVVDLRVFMDQEEAELVYISQGVLIDAKNKASVERVGRVPF